MEELAKDVFTAPLGTIFVLAGVLFLLIAVVGKISGKIEPGQKERVLSGILGSAFITIGLAMYWWSFPAPTVPAEKTKITKDKEITSPSQPPVKPQGSGGQKGDTSSSIESAGDGIPDWVPVYPEKVQNLSVKMREGGGQYGTFYFRTGEAPDAVLSFYQTNLEIQRWQVTKKEDSLSAESEDGSHSITVTSAVVPLSLVSEKWKYAVAFSEYKRQ